MSNRIYIVEQDGGKSSLVKATTAAEAIRFVAKPQFSARVPSMEEYGEMLMSGISVEDAGKEVK